MSENKKKKPAAKRKAANGYVKSEKVPLGTVLTDTQKKSWKVGPSIGSGGFGDIYSACSADSGSSKSADAYQYVVKIEPHNNGPLFVEMHFYMRNAKQDDIKTFMKAKSLTSLGMPYFVGSGSETINDERHRFIVMSRFGQDIWSLFLENGRRIPEHTVLRLGIQMLDVLEYIHQCTYVHADLKGANILLGYGKSGDTQAYLVDFGLASHYTTKDFKPDPKKMHNGTIEYTSRDAHNGVPTMRGDLEILAYNLLHWLGGKLPWESCLTKPPKVQEMKEAFMKSVQKSVSAAAPFGVSSSVVKLFEYVAGMEYNETPDYKKLRKYFEVDLKSLGKKNSGKLEFSAATVSPVKAARKLNDSVKVATPKRKAVASDVAPTTSSRAIKKEVIKSAAKINKRIISVEDSTPERTPPVKRLPRSAQKGEVIINNNIKPEGRLQKTYELNLELDLSLDARIIVNVNRKRKSAAKTDNDVADGSASKVKKVRTAPKITLNSTAKVGSRNRSSSRGKNKNT